MNFGLVPPSYSMTLDDPREAAREPCRVDGGAVRVVQSPYCPGDPDAICGLLRIEQPYVFLQIECLVRPVCLFYGGQLARAVGDA